MTDPVILKVALDYAARGWQVLPAKAAVQRACHAPRLLRRDDEPGDAAAMVCRTFPTMSEFALGRRVIFSWSTSMVMPASPA